jgi:hypothetical protein
VEKEETAVASIVPSVGRRTTAVPNVPRAVRVRLALGVQIVHWAMPEKETITMRRNASNVNWVNQQRLKVPLNAMLVIRDNLETQKVIVPPARKVFIKIKKAKLNAANAH